MGTRAAKHQQQQQPKRTDTHTQHTQNENYDKQTRMNVENAKVCARMPS